MGVNEKILEAIGICADNIVKKAEYNKTIQAQIMSCQDATIGKYKCKFQDAIFYAYNTNTEVSYINGANVYVLIPSNDMGKEKIILGATKKLGINYISQASDDEAYELVGQNCINNNNIYYLDTNYINYTYDIYNYERDKDKNNGIIDVKTLEYNLKHSTSMLVGATIKTNIDTNKQRNGHYGIAYTLRFYDNVYKEQTTRTYVLDEDSMISNPYKLVLNTRQYQVFHIDGENFIRIDAITIFNSDFPEAILNQPEQKPINSGDIVLSKFELYGANALSEQQINGIAITFYTPQGVFFTNADGDTQKTITAQVRIKGKLASSAQNIPFFWGRENVRIGPKDERYNKYLGRGWECLNQYTGQEWVPGNDTFILLRDEAPARNNRLKVAIVYNDNVITKQINIQNYLENAITINIQSDGGTEFHHDIGHPNLTCLLMKNNEIINGDNYSYYWSYYSTSEGNQQMPAADYNKINEDYVADLEKLDNLRAKELTEKYKIDLQNAEQAVQKYDYIQRVQGNKIYNVQIRKIVNFKTFKCSVYNGNQFLGTGEITLTNKLQSQDLYSLVINNGSVVYQYNENGVAPNNKKLQNPQIIPALTFNLYDDNGKLVDSESLIRSKECQVTWIFPKKDTLLVKVPIEIKTSNEQQQQPSLDDSNDDFCYYRNILNLPYNIATNYNINKQNNQIILNVKYKGKDVTARTNFTFTKQGQPGTNGTEYIVKIVPNTMMNNPPLYPMITKYEKENSYNLNYGIGNNNNATTINPNIGSQKYFNVQLWRNGELVDLTNSNDENTYTVLWENLKNKDEISNFEIDKDSGYITFVQSQSTSKNLSNIIKCSITVKRKQNGDIKTYYGTIPIITATVLNKDYQVQLKENSGFRYVLYSSDGVFPQYDTTNPFEIICKQKIGDFWEDISNISQEGEAAEYSLSYDFGIANDLLIATNKETETLNQKWYKPIEEFNGYATDAAVTCAIKQGRTIISNIHIPIHFLLNRYGLAHLNDWDGNSIQINENGGYILAPQMGAGTKDEHNTFTGVLMGEIIQPSKNNQLRIDNGLMGFHQGERSFFIDSETGGALFGKRGSGGQIAIDPNVQINNEEQNAALLYSHNFFKNYNDKGFPENYNYRNDKFKKSGNGKGQGMIINLSRPQIYFGSGNFYVTKDGYIHAAGGGDIAGWILGEDRLYTVDEKGNSILTLQSSTIKEAVYILCKETKIQGLHPSQIELQALLNNTYKNNILYLKRQDGTYIAIGEKGQDFTKINTKKLPDAYEFYNNTDKTYYFRKFGGNKGDKVKDEIGKNVGFVKGYQLYTYQQSAVIQQGKIFSNKHNTLVNTSNGFYLSEDGLSIGSKVKITKEGIAQFGVGAVVDSENNRYWTIDGSNGHSYISYGIKGNSNSVYLGTDLISLGSKFSVTNNGYLVAAFGTVGGWNIDSSKIQSTNQGLTLNSSGTLQGNGWYIDSGGFHSDTYSTFSLTGGSLTSSGGVIGAGGSGWLGGTSNTSAPLVYNSGGVTLRGKTQITNGATIGNFQIKNNAIWGSEGYITAKEVSAGTIKIDNLSFNGINGANRTVNLNNLKSGVATFSDGSTMTFRAGMLISITLGQGATWRTS